MNLIKAPNSFAHASPNTPKIFLAGSIEMGKAIDWQTEITNRLALQSVTVLNPRRNDWDSSWEQKITNPFFKEQVDWELDALNAADIVAMYLVPDTMSPISLLELGTVATKSPHKLIVCCPDGFWRKGNVDVVCQRTGVTQVATFEGLVDEVLKRVIR